MTSQPSTSDPARGAAPRPVHIAGIGSCVPERVLSNADLEKMVDTNDRWIQERTGIRERRIVEPGTGVSQLAVPAARRALEAAGIAASELDGIVMGTVSPDMQCPSAACLVQRELGADRAWAFDLNAACSAFVYSLEVGRALIALGPWSKVLVVGADVMSSFVDYQDRGTCIIFGDGAGAVVLRPAVGGEGSIIRSVLGAQGAPELLSVAAGGSRRPASAETVAAREHFVRMQGREIFKFAVSKMMEVTLGLLEGTGYGLADIDWVVPHQVNQRVFDMVFRKLDLPPEKVIVNIQRYGNTTGGSVPLAFDEAVRDGRIKRGDLVALVAFGAGLTWGGTLLRF